MRIALIAAIAQNGVIGRDGDLPWDGRMKADLQRFVNLTIGKPVIMGRKTYESIPPDKRPLANRVNIVLTRDTSYRADHPSVRVVHSIEEALARARETVLNDESEVAVIGGAEIYEQFIDQAHRMYVTNVHATLEGDVRFPHFDQAGWAKTLQGSGLKDEENAHDYSFFLFKRR